MTTPRDAIAGLTAYLRKASTALYLTIDNNIADELSPKLDEAATQLDALSARVSALQQNDDAMAAQIKTLVGQKTEWMDRATRAEQERDKLRSFTQELSDALLACRPLGGSELFVKRLGQYYADPVYCKAAIEQRIEAYHEAMKESVRNRKRAEKAEQERDEAYERAAMLALVQARQGATAEQIAAAIRQLKIASGPDKEKRE